MEIVIKRLQHDDYNIIKNVAPGLFDHPVDPNLTKELLEDRRHPIPVVIDRGRVIGFAFGVDYLHPDKPPELWINETAVAPTHRRRGLGNAMLHALLEVGRARKCIVAWVLTHRTPAAAVALYSSTGGTEGADSSGPSAALVGCSYAL